MKAKFFLVQRLVGDAKKNSYSIDFLNSWINIFENHFNLIDDSPSKIKNFEGFVENRHDQSVFSLLCKKNSISASRIICNF